MKTRTQEIVECTLIALLMASIMLLLSMLLLGGCGGEEGPCYYHSGEWTQSKTLVSDTCPKEVWGWDLNRTIVSEVLVSTDGVCGPWEVSGQVQGEYSDSLKRLWGTYTEDTFTGFEKVESSFHVGNPTFPAGVDCTTLWSITRKYGPLLQ